LARRGREGFYYIKGKLQKREKGKEKSIVPSNPTTKLKKKKGEEKGGLVEYLGWKHWGGGRRICTRKQLFLVGSEEGEGLF